MIWRLRHEFQRKGSPVGVDFVTKTRDHKRETRSQVDWLTDDMQIKIILRSVQIRYKRNVKWKEIFMKKMKWTCSVDTVHIGNNVIPGEIRDKSAWVNYYSSYMATIVRALWLAAERALFSCNDRALWNFFRLDSSFELWVKLSARGRKQQNRWTKYNYIPRPWCIDLSIARSIHQGLGLSSRLISDM